MSRTKAKHSDSLVDRLVARAAEVREMASKLADGDQKDTLLKLADQCDAAAMLDGWLRLKELVPPERK